MMHKQFSPISANVREGPTADMRNGLARLPDDGRKIPEPEVSRT
jgi:hypothetical protein